MICMKRVGIVFLLTIMCLISCHQTKMTAPISPSPLNQGSSSLIQSKPGGEWIWYPSDDVKICTFRKRFTIKSPPSYGLFIITCANAYRLFVNGTLLGQDNRWEDTEEYNLDKVLQVGENEVVIEGTNSWGPAGLWCRIEWKEGSQLQVLYTGEDWETHKGKKDAEGKWVIAKRIAPYPSPPWGDVYQTTQIRKKMLTEIQKTLSVEGMPEFLPPKQGRTKLPPARFQGVWLEAESTVKHNMEKAQGVGANGGEYLSIFSETLPEDGFFAQYDMEVTTSGWYEIWFSGRSGRKEFQAPVVWFLDGKRMGGLSFLSVEGEAYSIGEREFIWSQLARLRIEKGKHSLEFRISEKGEARDYTFWMDTVVAWCAIPDEDVICTDIKIEDHSELEKIKFKVLPTVEVQKEPAQITLTLKRADHKKGESTKTWEKVSGKATLEWLVELDEWIDPRFPPPRFEIQVSSKGRTLAKSVCVVGVDVFPNLPQNDARFDTYGGFREIKSKKTGFFRVEKVGDRWWLITPEGHGFFSKGMDVLQMLDVWSSPYARYCQTYYGSEENFARYNIGRILYFGFNSLGFWTTEVIRREARRQRMPYFINLHLLNCLYGDPLEDPKGNKWIPVPVQPWGWNVSDPFNPETKRRLLERCSILDPNDPWLVGYFIDNECPPPPFEFFYSKHTYPVWQDFLKKHYSNISELNKKWSSKYHQYTYSGFDQIHTDIPVSRGADDPAHKDLRDFQQLIVERSVELAMECIRTYDKNHMLCGLRFALDPNNTGVRYETLKKFDMNSINYYGSNPQSGIEEGFVSAPRVLANISGTPVVLTEFNASATDVFGDIGLGGKYPNQSERVKAISSMMLTLSAQPWLVGWHYFCWADSNTSENFNAGLVNWQDRVYEPFGSVMKILSPRLDDLILKSTFTSIKECEGSLWGPHLKIESGKVLSERGQGVWFWIQDKDFTITDGSTVGPLQFQTKDGAPEKKFIKIVEKNHLLLGGPMKVVISKDVLHVQGVMLSGERRPVKVIAERGGKTFDTIDDCFIYELEFK